MDDFFEHLEKTRQQVRDELMTRMKQRDTYSIELIVVLGALVAAYFAFKESEGMDILVIPILLIIPLLSIYFTKLIMYSYQVSDKLGEFLRTEIEPMFLLAYQEKLLQLTASRNSLSAKNDNVIESIPQSRRIVYANNANPQNPLCGALIEWQMYRHFELPVIQRGVRKSFFLYTMIFVLLFDFGLAYFELTKYTSDSYWSYPVYLIPIITIGLCLALIPLFIFRYELADILRYHNKDPARQFLCFAQAVLCVLGGAGIIVVYLPKLFS